MQFNNGTHDVRIDRDSLDDRGFVIYARTTTAGGEPTGEWKLDPVCNHDFDDATYIETLEEVIRGLIK